MVAIISGAYRSSTQVRNLSLGLYPASVRPYANALAYIYPRIEHWKYIDLAEGPAEFVLVEEAEVLMRSLAGGETQLAHRRG